MKEVQIQAEQYEKDRLKWLKINLTGFVIWDGMRITDVYLFGRHSHFVLILIQLIGWIFWGISLMQMYRLAKRTGNDGKLNRILNDELVVVNRLRAWKIGFIIVMATQVLMIIGSWLWGLSADFAAEITIYAGVIAALGTFIFHQGSLGDDIDENI